MSDLDNKDKQQVNDEYGYESPFSGQDSLVFVLTLVLSMIVLCFAVGFFYVLWKLRQQRDLIKSQIKPLDTAIDTEQELNRGA